MTNTGAVEVDAEDARLSKDRQPRYRGGRPGRGAGGAGADLVADTGDREPIARPDGDRPRLRRSQQLRPAENPARWRDLRQDLPAANKLKPVENHPALPWRQAPAFMAELQQREATAARALELVIRSACRTSEVLGSKWPEMDLDTATWNIPPGA